jgi:hypothetical protein
MGSGLHDADTPATQLNHIFSLRAKTGNPACSAALNISKSSSNERVQKKVKRARGFPFERTSSSFSSKKQRSHTTFDRC